MYYLGTNRGAHKLGRGNYFYSSISIIFFIELHAIIATILL